MRDSGFSRVTPTQRTTLLEQRRSCGSVDGAVHALTAEERVVGGVHDGVDILLSDVALYDFDHGNVGCRLLEVSGRGWVQ